MEKILSKYLHYKMLIKVVILRQTLRKFEVFKISLGNVDRAEKENSKLAFCVRTNLHTKSVHTVST
jgi:hypothetical protein